MQRLSTYLNFNSKNAYVVNLDPAVSNLPYVPNIDIRDTVDYKGVMKDFNLGPNGSIMTSLNLFATRFDQVLDFLQKRSTDNELDCSLILVDTPGQIEVFTWSASGTIITEALSSTLPTVLIYVIDTPRSSQPITFMSNMLYACSIMYRMHLPMVVVFNKADVQDYGLIESWMREYQVFQDAVSDTNSDSFMIPLTRSMGLVLEEFYNTMRTVGVSSVTGEGIGDLLDAIKEAKEEYFTVKKREEKTKEESKRQNEMMKKVKEDVEPEDRMKEGAEEIEENVEDEKERKEFENLLEWADTLKKEHDQME
ncbi:ATPase [Blastocystis sp. subtype 4]|uniref:ATPase n=1 Tax=Blastocystis sp. subtype 4 TaxID=944170 RepID=UPI0007120324|nr:ATPase [Blastocystis sp. subtype 4]KNB42496.1 ATPase [Blastocystis sp. subtype 4]|eukprot:XP_014525939.1 ATPase [Blastocystis sp. subtype 4]